MPESLTAVEEAQPASVDVDVNAAEPSTVETKPVEGSENKTTLDAVKAALASSDKSPKSEDQDSKPDAAAEVKTEAEDPMNKELKTLSRGAQQRFRELSNGNKTLLQENDVLKPKAENFDRIVSTMQRNQLDSKDVDNGFEIMGLIKLDPDKALERLAPIIRDLLKATGHELPEDLKAEIAAGKLTTERARELSTARTRADRLAARSETDRETQEANDNQRRHDATVNTATKAADAWIAEKAKADPDWHLKQNRVTDLVKLHVLETKKFPQSEKEARELFEEKLKVVETDMKRFLPKKQQIKPASGDASSTSTPTPKTTLDIIKGLG